MHFCVILKSKEAFSRRHSSQYVTSSGLCAHSYTNKKYWTDIPLASTGWGGESHALTYRPCEGWREDKGV